MNSFGSIHLAHRADERAVLEEFAFTPNGPGYLDRLLSAVELRLLPREIDRYSPAAHELADGAIFLLVNGRNPALLLVVENDGDEWQYGVGRLSSPSTLEVQLDGALV